MFLSCLRWRRDVYLSNDRAMNAIHGIASWHTLIRADPVPCVTYKTHLAPPLPRSRAFWKEIEEVWEQEWSKSELAKVRV